MQVATTALEDSRVRLDIEVPPGDLEAQVQRSAKSMGANLKLPGFRKGKVPPEVVIQRLGRASVVDEAVRHGLAGWYEAAVAESGVSTVGDPKIDLSGLPEKGEPLKLSIEVAVVPKARLGEYRGVEAARREPEVEESEIDEEVQRLRESLASLETVERPAGEHDFAVVDFDGTVDGEPFEGGEARGYLLELGAGTLVEGFEEQLVGAAAGEEREVRVRFPDDYRAEHLAGKDAVFATAVKEVKEKRLPDLDDDFAADAGGFDSLDELRADIGTRLVAARAEQVEAEFRESAVDAVAANAQVEVPHDLVHAKAHEMWHRTAHRLQHQGIDPATYLQMVGKTEEEVVTESEGEAERALRRESVLAAVVEAEGIEVSDEELMDSLREATSAAGAEQPSDADLRKLRDRLRSQGKEPALREDIAMRKAVDVVVESARPIAAETAEARGKIWTPDKEQQAPKELWTPGS